MQNDENKSTEMNEKVVFEFQKSFDYKTWIAEPLGRLILCKGSVVRLFFTPEGFKMYITKMGDDVRMLEVADDIELAGLQVSPTK